MTPESSSPHRSAREGSDFSRRLNELLGLSDAVKWGVMGGVVVLLIYAFTLAPGATLWDSGELLAAVHAFGVPHPPGTPLYVLIVRAWTEVLAFLPFATASNFASAVATAASCGLLGILVARAVARPVMALPVAVAVGAMSSVWSSATETEVYGFALLFNTILLLVGERAGRATTFRGSRLLAFLFGLGVSLHLSALIAGPAAIVLAGRGALAPGESAAKRRRIVVALVGAWTMAVGVGLASIPLLLAGFVVVLAPSFAPRADGQRNFDREFIWYALLVLLGCSALLTLMGLALRDPAINQGNPVTWRGFWAVVSREQYEVAGLWPRRAPLWLQLSNVIQYFDWQLGGGQSTHPGAVWWRTPGTVILVALAAYGAAWHRRTDRSSWMAWLFALTSASLGSVVILNLRAGPSFGFGFVPDGVPHEVRERDYFFLLAFALTAAWSIAGAFRLAEQKVGRHALALACAVAFMPVVLGAPAMNRRAEPRARLAELMGQTLLMNAPAGAILVLGGDNDTYPVWFVQQVRGLRRDVVPVTIPLLGAQWYRDELSRRHGLLATDESGQWRGVGQALRHLTSAPRPVVASSGVDPRDRDAIGGSWSFDGALYHQEPLRPTRLSLRDTMSTALAAMLEPQLGSRAPDDAAESYVWRLLHCPSAVAVQSGAADSASRHLLESTCNYR